MPGPYRSILNEYRKEIANLRKTHPPTPYSRIAELLKERHGVVIGASSIWSFVKARSIEGARKLKYVIAEEPSDEGTPGEHVELQQSTPEKEEPTLAERRKQSAKQPQKNETKLFDEEHFN